MLMGAKGYAKEVFTFGAPRAFFDGENTKCPAVTKEFRSFRFVNNFQLYTGCSEPGNGECQKYNPKSRANRIAYREVWDAVPMVPPFGAHCATHSFRLKTVTERPAGHRSSFNRWIYGDPVDIWVPKEDLINEIGDNSPPLMIDSNIVHVLKTIKLLGTAHSSVTYATVLCQSGWLNKPDPGGGEDLNTPICSEPVRNNFSIPHLTTDNFRN